MKRPEQRLHRAVAELLDTILVSAWWTTLPLGGGGKLRGAINKGLGTKDGIPDILIVDHSQAFWIELKAPNGRLSPEQFVCHAALSAAGATVFVCRSVDDVIIRLQQCGIKTRLTKAT